MTPITPWLIAALIISGVSIYRLVKSRKKN